MFFNVEEPFTLLIEETANCRLECRIKDRCAWVQFVYSQGHVTSTDDSVLLLQIIEDRIIRCDYGIVSIIQWMCPINVDIEPYTKLGYSADEIRIWDGVLKGYHMIKFIG